MLSSNFACPITVDEVQAFKPVLTKLLPVTDTESYCVCPVSYCTNCHTDTAMIRHCIHIQSSDIVYPITVENLELYKRTTNKPHLDDTDKDSAIGFSVFTGGKSTTLSEVSLLILLMTL